MPARKVPGTIRSVRQYWRGKSGHLPLETLPPITVALKQSGRKKVAVESLWLRSLLLSYHHGDETGKGSPRVLGVLGRR